MSNSRDFQVFQRAHARGLARGGGLASHPLCPGVELDQPPVRRGARVNPPGKSGGVRVIACPAGQGSSGESVPDGPARGATPTPRLRNDGGLASYASGMLSTLGLSEAVSPGFNPTVQLDKSGVPLFRSHVTPFVRRQGRRSPVRFQPGASATSTMPRPHLPVVGGRKSAHSAKLSKESSGEPAGSKKEKRQS